MSIKTALQSFTSATTFFIIASVFFVAGVTARVAFAGWVDPPDSPVPPNGGTAPINVANVDQAKTGGLYVAADTVGQLFVGVQAPDTDTAPRLKVNGSGKNYGISVLGATQTGIAIDGQSTTDYGIYVANVSDYAGLFRGHVRIDPDTIGGVNENLLDIYGDTGSAGSGLYVEQVSVNAGTAAIYGSGGETGVYGSGDKYGVQAIGNAADFSDTTYGVYATAGNALNTSKSYGVYAKAGLATNSLSYGLYGDTGAGTAGGKVYGLYAVNSATAGQSQTAFFEDANNINESSVEISSKSSNYGLKVVGGKDAVIYAEPRIRTGDLSSSLKAVYGKGYNSGAGEAQYGLYGEAGDVNDFGDTYGVYGKAGTVTGLAKLRTYGVYGDSNAQGYGVYAKGSGDAVAFKAENEDHGFGYAAKFSGLVDLGPDGVFSDGTTFLNDYVFAATYNGALSVGTLQPIGKLTVEGDGQYKTGLSARELWLTDQNGAGQTRYKLTVRDTNTDDPQLCIDIPTALCTERSDICTSRGFVSLRANDNVDCRDKCDDIDEATVTCRWNCSGQIGYDDCVNKGSETSGFEACKDYVEATFEPDNQAPSPNCLCQFQNIESGEGDIKEYEQAVYTGGYSTQCVDLAVAPK